MCVCNKKKKAESICKDGPNCFLLKGRTYSLQAKTGQTGSKHTTVTLTSVAKDACASTGFLDEAHMLVCANPCELPPVANALKGGF